MGIGEGLLGFIQGASGSLGAAAAKQVESDIDLERALSLEQITHQRNKTRDYQQIRAMQNALPEGHPYKEISPDVGVKGFEFTAEAISEQQEAAQKAERETKAIDFLGDWVQGKSTPEQQAFLLGVGALDPDDVKNNDVVFTADMLGRIPEFADEPLEVRQLYAANPTQALARLEGRGTGEMKLPVDLVNIETGQVESVPFNKAGELLTRGTHARGEVVFSGGQQVMRTSRGDFPFESPAMDKDLTPRARTYAALKHTVHNMPEAREAMVAEADPEFIRPELAIHLATGPQDRMTAGLRSFGATNALINVADESTLGEAELMMRKELLALRALTRNALVAANPGRANASTIELADELSPSDGTISAIFGSGDNVRLTLENLRGLMRSIRTTNEETVAGSFTPQTADRANEAINNVNRVIGRIESLFASEQIGQLRLNVGGNRTVTINNSDELKTSAGVKKFIDEHAARLPRAQKALLWQWQRHLMLTEGF